MTYKEALAMMVQAAGHLADNDGNMCTAEVHVHLAAIEVAHKVIQTHNGLAQGLTQTFGRLEAEGVV